MFKMPNEVKLHEEGFIAHLTDEMKEKIKEIESYGSKVAFVISGEHMFPGETKPAKMVCYVLKNHKPWKIDDRVTGLMACVVNESWGFEDTGSIGVIQYPDGYVRRVM